MKAMGPIPAGFDANGDGVADRLAAPTCATLVEDGGGTPLFVYDNNLIGDEDRLVPRRLARRNRAALCR